jgi:RimJ/RimL family protein N-acetyltransferase
MVISVPDAKTQFHFRPLAELDLGMLTEWLSRDHVVEWWGGPRSAASFEEVCKKYLPRMGWSSPVKCYIAELGDRPIGFIQSYAAASCEGGWWENETDPGVYGIDQFLADGSTLGQGLGTRMVTAFTHNLLADSSVTKVQVDPSPQNARAIRCYIKAGFIPVQEIFTPDGAALLMVAVRGQNL